jgi:peptidoglycan/xylan/chitin deacetylase (PgdA/CDA1 family)|tara:strand:- start:392 stop:1069 length:678 start_codon:yes stop_codon:yes gene_type:complete
MEIVICIDDTHPEKGWGMPDDECTLYLHKLNEEFGCKFVQFIPSNYHGKYPLSEHKDWVEYWNNLEWIELAAHGHYHDCRIGGPGECEMTEHDYESAVKRLDMCLEEWDKVGIKPKGWRMPGWLATQGSFDAVSERFDYVAIHETHNNNIIIKDNIKVFKGADGIHRDDCDINIWEGNTIMFQSHIAGPTNQNNWTKENYETFRNILLFLTENDEIEFKLLNEKI